ncbi:hypothetical protein N624_0131 [Levilactobacillus brevis]|nr:hypothetical protein N624_0131 [Levilactobacillus brevis]KIO99892.1 hypothetical protein N627_0311 [Levilactobacillus brevis]
MVKITKEVATGSWKSRAMRDWFRNFDNDGVVPHANEPPT